MAEITRQLKVSFVEPEEKRLLKELRQPSAKSAASQQGLYEQLFALKPENSNYGKKLTEATTAAIAAKAKNELKAAASLQLLKWSWHHEHGYAIVEGQVKNLTDAPMKNVTAVASFSDKKGGFITSDTTLIEFNPILSGQTSPFRVMARWNPEMHSAKLNFKHFMGGIIIHFEE